MASNSPDGFSNILALLMARQELSENRMRHALESMLTGKWDEVEIAAFLIALRMKRETGSELATAAQVLREHMVRFETLCPGVLDTCGTGGDGLETFNISTATAFVVAGAGVPVVKHGNRASSSRSGSADVLAILGLPIDADMAVTRLAFEKTGLAFCFAPLFHPGLRRVGPVRRRLGVRTLFNCLGPLANPASAPYQLLGVGWPELLDPLAGALAHLGTRHAFLVSGHDGLDEVTLAGPTRVREVRMNQVFRLEWTPEDFGLAPCSVEDLQVQSPQASAALVRDVLAGKPGPATRVVLANAAAAVLAAERVGSLPEGVALADKTLADGKPQNILNQLMVLYRETGNPGEIPPQI
ncbi:MAG TPA: anthranilate phosphoribosyltransferase [Gemmataceae bacterium]|nr:anthranilate phosphoribosyltransferase [Gemmataceae bacterium]